MAELNPDQMKPRTPRKNPTPRKRPHDYDVTALYSSPEDGEEVHGKPKSKNTRQSRTSPRKRKPKPSNSSATTFTPKKLFGTSPEGQQLSQRVTTESGNETEGSTQGSGTSKKSKKKKRSKSEIQKVKETIAKYEEQIAKMKENLTQKEDSSTTAEVEVPKVDTSDKDVTCASNKDVLSTQDTSIAGTDVGSSTHVYIVVAEQNVCETSTDRTAISKGVIECKYAITSNDNLQTVKEGTHINTGAQCDVDTLRTINAEVSEKEQIKSPTASALDITQGDNVANESDSEPLTYKSSAEESQRHMASALDITQGDNVANESDSEPTTYGVVESTGSDETHRGALPKETVEIKDNDFGKESVIVDEIVDGNVLEKAMPPCRDPHADSTETMAPSVNDVQEKSEPSISKSSNHKGRRGQSKDNSSLVNTIIQGVRASLVSKMMKTESDSGKTVVGLTKDLQVQDRQRPNRSLLKLKKNREVGKNSSSVKTDKSPTVSSSNLTASSSSTLARMSWKSPGAPSTPKQRQSVCTTRILSKSVEKVKRRVMFSPDKTARALKPSPSSSKVRWPKARAGIFPAGNGEVSWVDEDILPLVPDDEDEDHSEDINKLHTLASAGDGPLDEKNVGDKEPENQEKLVRTSRRLAIKRETKLEAQLPKKATKNTLKKPRGKQKTERNMVSATETLSIPGEKTAISPEDGESVPEPTRGTKRKASTKTKNTDDKPQSKRRKGTKKSQAKTTEIEPDSVGAMDLLEAVAGPSDLEKSLNDTPVKDDGSLSQGYELHLSDNDSQTKTIEELSMILLSLSQETHKASPLTTPFASPASKKSTPKVLTTSKKTPLKTPLKVNFCFRTPTKTPPRMVQASPARFVGRFSEQVRPSELSFQDADPTSSLPLPPQVGRLTCSAIEVLDTQADSQLSSAAEGAVESAMSTVTPHQQKKPTRRTFSVGRLLSRPSTKKKATQITRKYRTKRQESGWVQAVPDTEASTSQTSFADGQDSPGNRLKIVEVDDDDEWEDEELDENLDEKANAQNIRLTATNVKTIIREVITNEQVLDMVRNTLLEEDGLGDKFKEAIFEPRVTRAKIKQAVEKGDLPQTWPLTPVKGVPPTPTPKTFTDLELPDDEEEDDDDYDPDEVLDESDVDSESVVSSRASDFGSPRSQLSKTPTPCKSGLQPQAFFMRENSNSQSILSDMEPPLAERLRSKMSLTDKALEEIEANFVQPDLTPDLYNTIAYTTPTDKDWQNFLCQIHTTTHSEMNDTYDEKNDPEYNFQAETEQEAEDIQEYRTDKAVKITKKEMTELMEELFDAYQDTMEDDTKDDMPENQLVSEMRRLSGQLKPASPLKQSYKPKVPPMILDTPGSVLVVGGVKELMEGSEMMDNIGSAEETVLASTQHEVPTFTADELFQLQDQMRKHVQLLTQTFVLSTSSEKYADQGKEAANLLEELNVLGERQVQTRGTGSFFLPVNLNDACDLIRTGLPTGPFADRLQSKVWVRLQEKGWKRSLGPVKDFALHWTQMEVFSSSSVFLFPQMLPETRFYERIKTPKFQIFSEAEDNLVAMGLVQFEKVGKLTKRYQLISQYMMPTKTPTKIQLRIKRLRAKSSPDNIIRTLFNEEKLPEFERYLELEDVDSLCAPEDRDPDIMPTWYKFYERVKTEMFKNGQYKLSEYDMNSTRCSTPDSFSDAASDCTEERDARRSSLKIPGQKRKSLARGQEKKQTPDLACVQSTTPLPNPLALVDMQVNPVPPALPVTQYVILTNPSTPVQMSTAAIDSSPPPSNPVIIMSTVELQRYGAQLIDTVASTANDSSTVPTSQVGLCSISEQGVVGTAAPPQDPLQGSVGSVQCPGTQITQTLRPPVMSMPTLQDLEEQVPASIVESADMDTVDVDVDSNQVVQAPVSDVQNVVQQTEPTVINIQRMTEWRISDNTKTPHTFTSPAHHVVICSPAACNKVHLVHNVVASPLTAVETPCTQESPPKDPLVNKDGGELDNTLTEKDQATQPVQLGSPAVVVSQEDQFQIPGVEPLDAVSPIRIPQPVEPLVSPTPIAATEISTENVISEQPTTNTSITNTATVSEPAPPAPTEEASSTETTPLKTRQAEDSPSKLLSPANLLLVGGNKIDNTVNLDVCDLQLEADHQSFNDSIDKSCDDTDTSMYVINTPQKFVPNEENSCSPTVYSDRSYSNSPGFSDNTPPRNLNTPTKCAVEIMAAYAQYMTTPPQKRTPHKPSNLLSCSTPSPRKRFTPSKLFLSPPNRPLQTSPIRFRKISPHPGAQTPPRVLSPIPKKHTKSPRRKILQQQARAILPKGFVASTFSVSPTKKAAASLRKRARTRSGYRKILPKALDLTSGEALATGDENEDTDIDVIETDFASEYDTLDSEFASEDNQSADEKENNAKALSPKPETVPPPKAKRQRRYKKKKEKKPVEDNESGSEDDGFGFTLRVGAESQDEADEDDPFAQFMAASTTIRFDPKSRSAIDRHKSKSKAKAKREMTLHMLAPDLVGGDVMRDERDTAFAQAYLARVKHALKDNKDTLEAFLKLLYDFGQSEKTPVELHTEVEKLLVNHPEVMADFSGFLLPDQAQQCGCFVTNLEFGRARSFLRKIETFFSKHPSHLQKILKAFATWKGDADELRNQVVPLLRGQQHLVDQFTSLFATDKPTNDHADDFEEVHMQEDDDSTELPTPETSMEEISLPEASEDALYGTGRCRCQCHDAADKQYSRRKNHCHSCSMKIIQGKLYMQTMEKTLRPVQVLFLGSVPKCKRRVTGTVEEEAQKEDALSSEEDIIHDPLLDATNNQQAPKKYKAVRKRVRASKSRLKVKLPEPKQQVESLPKESQVVHLEHSEPNSPINITQDSLLVPQSAAMVAGDQKAAPTDFSIFRSEIQASQNAERSHLSQMESTPAAVEFTNHSYINQETTPVTSTGSPFKIIIESTMTGATGMSHSAPRMRIASKDIRMTQVDSGHDSSNSPSPSANSNSNSQTNSTSNDAVPDANSNSSNLAVTEDTQSGDQSAHVLSAPTVNDESANMDGHPGSAPRTESSEQIVMRINLDTHSANQPETESIDRPNQTGPGVSQPTGFNRKADETIQEDESCEVHTRPLPQPFLCDDATMGFNVTMGEKNEREAGGDSIYGETDKSKIRFGGTTQPTPQVQEEGVVVREKTCHADRVREQEETCPSNSKPTTEQVPADQEQPAFRGLLQQTLSVPCDKVAKETPASKTDWTRDEDKEILVTCQEHGEIPDTFICISQKLVSHPTVEQVKQRYAVLMQLFEADPDCTTSSDDDDV